MIKKLFRYSLILIVPALVYGSAIGLFYWRWMIPHEAMPAGVAEAASSQLYAPEYDDLAAGFEAKIRERRAALHAPSISAAVGIDGKLAWAGAVGYAHMEAKTPADINSQYRIGSTAKTLTATVMMRLVAEGKLDLDEDIRTYLPDYQATTPAITPRLLASHMSGTRHYRKFAPLRWPPSDSIGSVTYASATDSLVEFQDDPLLFPPGSDFSYSTYGFVLLSAVMESVTGQTFPEIMQQQMFAPLAMSATLLEKTGRKAPNMAGFYTTDDGVWGPAYPVDDSKKWAGGGILSTPSDMVRVGLAILGDDYLGAGARATMFERQLLPSGEDNRQFYALGWRHYETQLIFSAEDKIDVIHHGGVSAGGASFFILVPDYGIAISILSNSASGNIRGEIQTMAYEMVGEIIRKMREAATGGAAIER
ncbi:MAG: serine hydrolase domain-containing protein [Sphingomonadales bacterium]